eukprot:CAMPEP_0194391206 /NCGR_PEP_ID=MMETSP0174-20130528/114365_1 /TAXON_ID=216777 /ORGANISM="Proboscia alata, Strain PI-D3" /LENGTH=61 /DNA_ID=CAMNT_0039185311 /DNA_START=268 /DNA_END=453 /DNA_ORIENTATION=-
MSSTGDSTCDITQPELISLTNRFTSNKGNSDVVVLKTLLGSQGLDVHFIANVNGKQPHTEA